MFVSSLQEETEELKKRVAVLECQLRKSEAAKKSFEMSTGKLLSFVEVNNVFVCLFVFKKIYLKAAEKKTNLFDPFSTRFLVFFKQELKFV